MSGAVIAFPPKRSKPNAIEVQFDLGEWTIAYYSDRRFTSRLSFASKGDAETEARRLVEAGMTLRCGPNGAVYLMPDSHDGGCWAVAHRSRSDDTDALLGRHFSLDEAISDGVRHAQVIGAEISVSKSLLDGGAA